MTVCMHHAVQPDGRRAERGHPRRRPQHLQREQEEPAHGDEQQQRLLRRDAPGRAPIPATRGVRRERVVDRWLGAPHEPDLVHRLLDRLARRVVVLQELRACRRPCARPGPRRRRSRSRRGTAGSARRPRRARRSRPASRSAAATPGRARRPRRTATAASAEPAREHERQRDAERHVEVAEHRERQGAGAGADRQDPEQLVAAQARRQRQADDAEPADPEQQDPGRRRAGEVGYGAAADDAGALGQADREQAGEGCEGRAASGVRGVAARAPAPSTRLTKTGLPTR